MYQKVGRTPRWKQARTAPGSLASPLWTVALLDGASMAGDLQGYYPPRLPLAQTLEDKVQVQTAGWHASQ